MYCVSWVWLNPYASVHVYPYTSLSEMADSELVELLNQRIPEARNALRDSHSNLESLANYCEQNYVTSGQTQKYLDDTKLYAAQSLASVAYQVNVLASGMLELLDKQTKHMTEMESNIRHISQVSRVAVCTNKQHETRLATYIIQGPCMMCVYVLGRTQR